jgi:hypothetical protein
MLRPSPKFGASSVVRNLAKRPFPSCEEAKPGALSPAPFCPLADRSGQRLPPAPRGKGNGHTKEVTEVAKDHGSSVKDDKQYEGLRKKGMSKQRAAKIANTPGASKKGGKKQTGGSGGGTKEGQRKGGRKSS